MTDRPVCSINPISLGWYEDIPRLTRSIGTMNPGWCGARGGKGEWVKGKRVGGNLGRCILGTYAHVGDSMFEVRAVYDRP